MKAINLDERCQYDDPAYWVAIKEEALLNGNDAEAAKATEQLKRLNWRAEPIAENGDGNADDR